MSRRYRYNRYVRAIGTGLLGYAGYKELTRGKSKVISSNNLLPSDTMATKKGARVGGRKRRGRRTRRAKIIRRRFTPVAPPQSMKIIMKTCMNTSLDAGAGTLATQTIALNGAFDPSLALGTQQPLYYDQMAALYQKYCVIGWKVLVEAVTVDNTNATVFGFCPLNTSAALSSYLHYKECKGNKSITLTPDIDKGTLLCKGNVERKIGAGKKSHRIMSDDRLYATSDTNPTDPIYGHIYAQSLTGAQDPAAVYYNITLWQVVVWFDPITPSRSS